MRIKKLVVFFLFFPFLTFSENYFYKNFSPPKVLFIANSHYRADFAYYIERITGAKLKFVQIFYDDQDYHHLCNKPLEETKNDMDFVNNEGEKYLNYILENLNDFDIIFASFPPNSKDEKQREKIFNIEKKIVEFVKNGKSLVFINPSWEIVFDNTPISEIMPAKFDGIHKIWTFCPGKSTEHPLTCGLPFEITGTYWYGPVYVAFDENSIKLTERKGYPNFWYRKVEKGDVVFLYDFPKDRIEWIGTNYSSYSGDRPDESEVWHSFFNRLVWYLKYKENAFPVFINIKFDDDRKIKYDDEIEIPVKVKNYTDKKQNISLDFVISSRYSENKILDKKIIQLSPYEEKIISFKSKVNIPCLDRYLCLKVKAMNEKNEIISESYKYVDYLHKVPVSIKTDKFSYVENEDIKVDFEIKGEKGKEYTVYLFLLDRNGRILKSLSKVINLKNEKEVLNFSLKMLDGGPEFLSGYFLKGICLSENEIVGSSEFLQIHNDEKWDMRKQFQFSLWTNGGPYPKMKLLFDSGFNSLGYPGNSHLCDKYGLRQYVEGTGINTFGVEIKFDNWEDVRKDMEKVIENLNKSGPDSRSKCLVSLQEEGGFDGGWGTRYYWKEDKAPEIPKKVFDDYLKEIYDNDIEKLNEEWNTNYKSFEEIPLEKNKCTYPSSVFVTSQAWEAMKSEEKNKKIPVELKNPDISKKYLCYSSPYYQTYRFFDWYYQKYCDLATLIYKKNRNPVPLTICSAPGGFYPKVDVYNFAGLGTFYPKETGLCGNAIARRDYGDIPGFSGAMWAYFDLYTLWKSTVLSSIIAGNTHIDYWVDTPLTFNPDLTHTRASFWTKELTNKLKEIEPILLHKKFHYTKGLGLFTGIQPFEKGVLGKHFGSAISCNAPVYSALEESGYMPKVINLDELSEISILITSYAQVINREEGEKIKNFVKNGGILISTPWIASFSKYGNPYTVYPSPESGLYELLGFKLINTSQDLNVEEIIIDNPEYSEIKGLLIKSKGKDKVINISPDVKVISYYKDGTPALLERKYGKGKVIYLNFIYDWDNWWNSFYEKYRENYRKLIDYLIRKEGKVKRDYFVSFVNAEKTELNKGWWGCMMNQIPQKGEAIPWWAGQLYSDPKGKIKYLFIFSDHRSPVVKGEIIFDEKNISVFDLLERKEIKKNENGNYNIELKPGDAVLLSIVKDDEIPVGINVSMPTQIYTGENLNINISLKGVKDATYGAIVEIFSPSGEKLKTHSIYNAQLEKGAGKVSIPFAENEREGNYKILIKESITGMKIEKEIRVISKKPIFKPENLKPFPERKEDNINLFEMKDDEFVENFRKLKNIYTGNYSGLYSKYMLSYYLYVPFAENRHSIIRKLQRTNWLNHFEKFVSEIRNGEKFILVGEDLNFDPYTKIEIDPLATDDIGNFIKKLETIGEIEEKVVEGVEIKVIKIGKGFLTIIYDSADRYIYHSDDFEKWHNKIKKIISEI